MSDPRRRLRVAMIQSFLPSGSPHGGVGLQAHQLANQLVARGHDVTVFTRDPRPDGARYQVERLRSPSFLDHKLLLAGRVHLFPWLLAALDFSRFDVVHAHGDASYLLRARGKLVRTFHGSALDEALGALRTERLRPRDLYWSTLQASLYGLEWLSAAWAERTVGISEATRSRLPFIHTIVGEGVDTELFSPGDEALRSEAPLVLFVGSLGGRKRGWLLERIFREEVLPVVPEARLWLVCEKEGEDGPVRWLRRRPNRELVELFRQAWIFCLPSSYEGFGIPYVEAMATRTAVVATPNPGAAEVLDHGNAGLLAEPEQLADALLRLIRDPGQRERFAAAGLARSRRYSFAAIASAYEGLYYEVVRAHEEGR